MTLSARFVRKMKEILTGFKLLSKNVLARVALIIMAIIILIAIFAPIIVPYMGDVTGDVHPEIALQAPSSEHLFGTDELGRDIFSKVLYGTRYSVFPAVLTVLVAVVLGGSLGAFAGSQGGMVDEVIMRITDIFLSFPPLLLAITISALLGPSLMNSLIAVVFSWWPWYARYVRSQAILVKEKQFVKAADAIGTKRLTIIFKHIVPNCIAPVITQASMDMGSVIMTVASLSFLGLGAQSPTPEWGLMISTSKNYFMNAWWYGIFPGIAIFITVLCFNLIGDGLREVLDPKTRKS